MQKQRASATAGNRARVYSCRTDTRRIRALAPTGHFSAPFKRGRGMKTSYRMKMRAERCALLTRPILSRALALLCIAALLFPATFAQQNTFRYRVETEIVLV